MRRCHLWVVVLLVNHHDRPAAWVTPNGIELYPRVAAFEPDHPTRRWVICEAIFALEILAGHICGPFTQPRADHFARCALMPDEEFASIAGAADASLAEYFNVPLEQIAEKRLDLLAVGRI